MLEEPHHNILRRICFFFTGNTLIILFSIRAVSCSVKVKINYTVTYISVRQIKHTTGLMIDRKENALLIDII